MVVASITLEIYGELWDEVRTGWPSGWTVRFERARSEEAAAVSIR